MLPSPTHATQSHQAHHQREPSAVSAKADELGCHQVPPLPRRRKANVAKSHACHATPQADKVVCDKAMSLKDCLVSKLYV